MSKCTRCGTQLISVGDSDRCSVCFDKTDAEPPTPLERIADALEDLLEIARSQ